MALGLLPQGLVLEWQDPRWTELENALLRVEHGIRLLDRASPSQIVQIRDRALSDPRLLSELSCVRYETPSEAEQLRRTLESTRAEVARSSSAPLNAFLLDRIEELERELDLAEELGNPGLRQKVKAVYEALPGRDLAQKLAQEWLRAGALGEGDDLGPLVSLAEVARRELENWPGLRVVERPLLSRAAAGDGVLFVRKGLQVRSPEAERIVLHEIHGHLLVRQRARGFGPPFRIGCRESGIDEEGRAVALELQFGRLSSQRRRELGLGHHVAERVVEGGAPLHIFEELVTTAPSREVLITAICRAFRGGGLCRELAYLVGFERVVRGAESEPALMDRMGLGRLSVEGALGLWRQFGSCP